MYMGHDINSNHSTKLQQRWLDHCTSHPFELKVGCLTIFCKKLSPLSEKNALVMPHKKEINLICIWVEDALCCPVLPKP